MQFRTWHIFLVIAVSAVVCVLIERQIYRTAILEVVTVNAINDDGFSLVIEVADGVSPHPQTRMAFSRFGENAFFDQTAYRKNLKELVGVHFKIRYQNRDFLWLEREEWEERVSTKFPETSIIPTVEQMFNSGQVRQLGPMPVNELKAEIQKLQRSLNSFKHDQNGTGLGHP